MRNVRKVQLSGSDGAFRSGACRLMGFAIRETGGAASATVLIYDGTTAAGDLIPVALSAGESTREWWGSGGEDVAPGLLMEKGIYVDVGGTGVVQGCLFVLDGN